MSISILFLVGLLLFLTPNAFAQEMGFLNPNVFEQNSLTFEHQQIDGSKKGQELKVYEQRGSLNVPLYSGAQDGFALVGRAHQFHLGRSLTFAKSGLTLPQAFGTAEGGLLWIRKKENRERFGVSATYGDSGRQLFESGNSPILSALFFWERPAGEDGWIYLLSYSNNRTFLNNIPLPGFAYAMNRGPWRSLLGLPFLFTSYRGDLLSGSGFLSPFGAGIEGTYRIWGPVQALAGLSWSPKAVENLSSDREQRVIMDRKEINMGPRLFLGPGAQFSLTFVHSFDRRLILGRSINNTQDSLRLSNDNGLQFKARVSF